MPDAVIASGCRRSATGRAPPRKPRSGRSYQTRSRQVLAEPPSPNRGGRSVAIVDNRAEVRDFLASRRAKITPEQAGLTLYGRNRRVPGLRREEVARLAGLSVDYYTRLEKGSLGGASDGVLDAIAGALQLDDVERAHLFDLARAAHTAPARAARRRAQPEVRPSV